MFFVIIPMLSSVVSMTLMLWDIILTFSQEVRFLSLLSILL